MQNNEKIIQQIKKFLQDTIIHTILNLNDDDKREIQSHYEENINNHEGKADTKTRIQKFSGFLENKISLKQQNQENVSMISLDTTYPYENAKDISEYINSLYNEAKQKIFINIEKHKKSLIKQSLKEKNYIQKIFEFIKKIFCIRSEEKFEDTTIDLDSLIINKLSESINQKDISLHESFLVTIDEARQNGYKIDRHISDRLSKITGINIEEFNNSRQF